MFHPNLTCVDGNNFDKNQNITIKMRRYISYFVSNAVTLRKVMENQNAQAVDDTIGTAQRNP